MRNTLLVSLVLGMSALMGAGVAGDSRAVFDTRSANTLVIAAYGDAPYGTSPADTAQFQATPGFIDSINADTEVELVLHVGDIHSGKQYCTADYDRSIFALWTAFHSPLVYTPGDNEWSDCHKVAEGGGAYNATTGQIAYVPDADGNPVDYAGGDPIANLQLVRSIFFANPGQALGQGFKIVLSQSQAFDPRYPSDANYVENVMWVQSKVLFVTINLPGGSNNDTDVWYGTPTRSDAQIAEINERTNADLRWLDAAFAVAQAANVRAVLIQAQADMWDPEKGVAHQAASEPFVASIAAHALALGKPVLMLNGDSHVYRSDNPLLPSDDPDSRYFMHTGCDRPEGCYNVPNFHRIVVHGSTAPLEWLRLTLSPRNPPSGPDTFGPFGWTRVIP